MRKHKVGYRPWIDADSGPLSNGGTCGTCGSGISWRAGYQPACCNYCGGKIIVQMTDGVELPSGLHPAVSGEFVLRRDLLVLNECIQEAIAVQKQLIDLVEIQIHRIDKLEGEKNAE